MKFLRKATVPVILLNGEASKEEVLEEFINALNATLCSLGKSHGPFNASRIKYLTNTHLTLPYDHCDCKKKNKYTQQGSDPPPPQLIGHNWITTWSQI